MKKILFAFTLCLSLSLFAGSTNDRSNEQSLVLATPQLNCAYEYCFAWVYCTWSPVPNATAYEVFYTTASSGNYYKIATVTGTEYEFNRNNYGFVKVRAISGTSTGPFSNSGVIPYYNGCY